MHRAELLSWVANEKKLIGVAGTNGKTTTTALLAHMMRAANETPPSLIFGGEWVGPDEPLCWRTDSPYIVAEIDESDGSIQQFNPYVAVVTSVTLDHPDYFSSLEHMRDLFFQFLEKAEACQVVNWDDPVLRTYAGARRLSYGRALGSEIRLREDSVVVERTEFPFSLPMLGDHNSSNALAALSTCHSLGLEIETCVSSLKNYPGVKRRQELLWERDGIKLYSDYAHNPDKVAACLKAFSGHDLIAIFEPHRPSRFLALQDEFKVALKNSNELMITAVYGAGENDAAASEALHRFCSAVSAFQVESTELLLARLELRIRKPVTIVVMGAGHAHTIALAIRDFLDRKFT